MRRMALLLVLGWSFCFVAGCAKIKLGDPLVFPGTMEKFGPPDAAHAPMFKNGDIVHYKMLTKEDADGDEIFKRGIVMQCDFKYIPRLETYYCIVDFYPTSVDTFGSSDFSQYERRYVYEYELELEKEKPIPARWAWMNK